MPVSDERHYTRVNELLEASNRHQEEARAARRKLRAIRKQARDAKDNPTLTFGVPMAVVDKILEITDAS